MNQRPYFFGPRSRDNLMTCSPELVAVAERAIQFVDFSVIEGSRSVERQQQLFAVGRSHLDGETKRSKHQISSEDPFAHAFDIIPYPSVLHGVNVWRDESRITLFAGEILAVGWQLGVELIWGGDWNGDGSRADHTFFDGPHFEEKAA